MSLINPEDIIPEVLEFIYSLSGKMQNQLIFEGDLYMNDSNINPLTYWPAKLDGLYNQFNQKVRR